MSRFACVTLKFSICCGLALLAGCGGNSQDSAPASSFNEKIVNGVEQPEAASPQVVEIVFNFADGTQGLCTGTIIGSDSILTAGHCFENVPASVFVKAGGKFVQATKAIVHPGYFPDPTVQAIFNDAAILKTPPLGLPLMPLEISQPIQVGGDLMVLGFGLDENGNYGTLKVGISSVEFVTENHVFGPAFDGSNVNPCNGDSGGPAVQTFTTQTGETYTAVVGVVSTGTVLECKSGDMTLYTNIENPAIAQFIVDNVPDVVFR